MMIKDNPEMTTAEIDAPVALMKGQGIVDSGGAVTAGIGAMSQRRIEDFYSQIVKAGLYKPGEVDMSTVAPQQLVKKRVGKDLKTQLTKCC
jgi:NitT/TauT family transport system substrate-binding protein